MQYARQFTVLIFLFFATLTHANATNDNKFRFTVGSGLPFLIVPEISVASDDNKQRYYLNLKGSADSGASIGFEQIVGQSNQHAMGVVLGTIGLKNNDDPVCDPDADDIDLVTVIAEIIACGVGEAFDWEVTNGVGVTYSYNFQGLNQSGWSVRFEGGYGAGRKSGDSRADGSVIFYYNF